MKKILFVIALAIMVLVGPACSVVFAQQYDSEYYSAEDFAYLDDYSFVEWTSPKYSLQYSYYDVDRVFLVIYGNRLYIVPWEYFWHYIYPHFSGRIIWRSYDYLVSWLGWRYYNNLWDYWYHKHGHRDWRPGHDWYEYHSKRNNNKRIIIRKHELQPNYGDKIRKNSPHYRDLPRNEHKGAPYYYKNDKIRKAGESNQAQIWRRNPSGAHQDKRAAEKTDSGEARARKKD